MTMRYKTDTDYRKALEARLRQRAEQDGEPIPRLRKRVVFERGMVRLQQDKNNPWEVDTLKKLQGETAAELDSLLPSILDRAFKGEL